MTQDSGGIFINKQTLEAVPDKLWRVVDVKRLGRVKAYPVEVVADTTVITIRGTVTLHSGFKGWIAKDEHGWPQPVIADDITFFAGDDPFDHDLAYGPSAPHVRTDHDVRRVDDVDPTLLWLLRRAGDEWGHAGVIDVTRKLWPDAFEHVAHHKVVVSESST